MHLRTWLQRSLLERYIPTQDRGFHMPWRVQRLAFELARFFDSVGVDPAVGE